jgi:plastocyanin
MPRGRNGRRRTVAIAGLAAVVAAAALAACGSSDEGVATGSSGGGSAQKSSTLTIENFRFRPNPLVVSTGARVKVTNSDDAAHTVTAEDKSFDTGNVAALGEAEITPSKAGELAYFCSIHDYMRGVIRVSG